MCCAFFPPLALHCSSACVLFQTLSTWRQSCQITVTKFLLTLATVQASVYPALEKKKVKANNSNNGVGPALVDEGMSCQFLLSPAGITSWTSCQFIKRRPDSSSHLWTMWSPLHRDVAQSYSVCEDHPRGFAVKTGQCASVGRSTQKSIPGSIILLASAREPLFPTELQ